MSWCHLRFVPCKISSWCANLGFEHKIYTINLWFHLVAAGLDWPPLSGMYIWLDIPYHDSIEEPSHCRVVWNPPKQSLGANSFPPDKSNKPRIQKGKSYSPPWQGGCWVMGSRSVGWSVQSATNTWTLKLQILWSDMDLLVQGLDLLHYHVVESVKKITFAFAKQRKKGWLSHYTSTLGQCLTQPLKHLQPFKHRETGRPIMAASMRTSQLT